MTVPVFLEFVEIKTKLASLFPFVLGTLFTLYRFGSINALNTILFFIAMVVFDMATTAIRLDILLPALSPISPPPPAISVLSVLLSSVLHRRGKANPGPCSRMRRRCEYVPSISVVTKRGFRRPGFRRPRP